MITEGRVVLQQTVHGYRAGHELLRSSTVLPSDAQRTMLVQSDLSGPILATGFEEYVSGYPIDSIGVYVLARTWYAPEMDRPGCVWTHSLLVSFADLALLPSLSAIAQAFNRPTKEVAYEGGPLPALSLQATSQAAPLPSEHLEAGTRVLAALYSEPTKSVVTFAATASAAEPVVFAIWTQQWPRLRRSFRFCSGAVASRVQDGVPFDLLVAPVLLRSRIQRELSDAVVAEELPQLAHTRWIATGMRDLRGAEPKLKEFLWLYGADVTRPRTAWRALVEVFSLLHDEQQEEAVVGVIGETFAAPGDARRLKSDLLGTDAKLRAGNVDIVALLSALGTTAYPESFSDDDLETTMQVVELWRAERQTGLRLLKEFLERPLNRHGERMLEALLREVGPSAAMDLERLKPGILATLVARNPRLATDASVWMVSADRQQRLFGVLTGKGLQTVLDSIGAMIRGGADSLVGEIEQLLGESAAARVLSATTEDESVAHRVRRSSWSGILHRRPQLILDWLRDRAFDKKLAHFQLAVDHLDPRWHEVRACQTSVWRSLLSDVTSQNPSREKVRDCAFLLSIALGNDHPDSSSIIAATFPTVYEAAARYSLADDAWEWLSGELPPKEWYRGWDKCERLSLGIARRFLHYHWPIRDFFRANANPETLKQTITVARDEKDTRDLVERIERDYRRGALDLTRAQRDVLDDWL